MPTHTVAEKTLRTVPALHWHTIEPSLHVGRKQCLTRQCPAQAHLEDLLPVNSGAILTALIHEDVALQVMVKMYFCMKLRKKKSNYYIFS